MAAGIAELVELQYGIVAGAATERDGRDDSGLTNDFTFDDAEPPFAVEVTRLRDDFEHPSEEEHRRLERDLRRRVAKNGWPPDWVIGIRPETKRSSVLEPAIARIIEWMVAANLNMLGPATYTIDVPNDLLSRMGNGFMQDCDRARMAGVILVGRGNGDGIHVMPVVEFSDSRSLQRPLARAFEKKTASLGKAKRRGYVTMLGVDVEREDAHGYLNEATRAPGFPLEIDHLWLIVRGLGKAFYARRDDRRFRMIDLPDLTN